MRATGKTVITKMVFKSNITAGGLILPGKDKERKGWTEVVAVGPDVEVVKIGDRIIANPNRSFKVTIKKEEGQESPEFICMTEEDILIILDDDDVT